MASLKQGEFVGSLDCGTTCVSPTEPRAQLTSRTCTDSSTRFLIFDKHADIVAQHQIEYPQYYPEPGCVFSGSLLSTRADFADDSWHEQDPDELVESCDVCITEACKALEAAGWANESVKVIGASQHHSQPKQPAD